MMTREAQVAIRKKSQEEDDVVKRKRENKKDICKQYPLL